MTLITNPRNKSRGCTKTDPSISINIYSLPNRPLSIHSLSRNAWPTFTTHKFQFLLWQCISLSPTKEKKESEGWTERISERVQFKQTCPTVPDTGNCTSFPHFFLPDWFDLIRAVFGQWHPQRNPNLCVISLLNGSIVSEHPEQMSHFCVNVILFGFRNSWQKRPEDNRSVHLCLD